MAAGVNVRIERVDAAAVTGVAGSGGEIRQEIRRADNEHIGRRDVEAAAVRCRRVAVDAAVDQRQRRAKDAVAADEKATAVRRAIRIHEHVAQRQRSGDDRADRAARSGRVVGVLQDQVQKRQRTDAFVDDDRAAGRALRIQCGAIGATAAAAVLIPPSMLKSEPSATVIVVWCE